MEQGIWIEVKIMPRKEILDVEGRAVMNTLKQNGKPVEDCRVGKCIRLFIKEQDSEKAKAKAKEIAETLLHNPLTETFELSLLS